MPYLSTMKALHKEEPPDPFNVVTDRIRKPQGQILRALLHNGLITLAIGNHAKHVKWHPSSVGVLSLSFGLRFGLVWSALGFTPKPPILY
jgi:hypothetical protein